MKHQSLVYSDYLAYNLSPKGLILGFFAGHAFYAVLLYRIGNYLARHKIPYVPYLFGFWQLKVFGCEISPYATIGRGFRLYHTPGIVIGWGAELGDDCEVFQNVTIGENRKTSSGRRFPKIGNHCSIYAGACILGPVTLGDGCVVGANSVVTHDFPASSVLVGAPARVIQTHDEDKT